MRNTQEIAETLRIVTLMRKVVGWYKNLPAGLQIVLGLSLSNLFMMAAWFLLLPVPMPIWFAILPSWLLAGAEYLFHVTANRETLGSLGVVRQRGFQEFFNFCAFILISALAGEKLSVKYFVALVLVGLVAYVFIISEGALRKRLWKVVGTGLLVFIAAGLSLLNPVRDMKHGTGVPGIILPGGLPLILLGTCLVANGFMVIAWYNHHHVTVQWLATRSWLQWAKRVPVAVRVKNFFDRKPWLFAYVISWGTALFEYSVLIPSNRLAYLYITIIALFGYMEITTLTVFLPFAWFTSRTPGERKLTVVQLLGFLLLIAIEVTFLVF